MATLSQVKKKEQIVQVELLANYSFERAKDKAFSREGYKFKIESGDEFVLFARRKTPAQDQPNVTEEEEVKLDLFHVKGGALHHAAFMDRANTYFKNGSAESLGGYSIPWAINSDSPPYLKIAEKARAELHEGASVVFDEYTAHKGGNFKGIGSFLLGFQTEYARSRGVTTVTHTSLSPDGKALMESFYSKVQATFSYVEDDVIKVELANAKVPKLSISKLTPGRQSHTRHFRRTHLLPLH